MNKELSPLKALERVNKAFHTALIFADVKQKDEETEKALNIIETALKALEIIKNKCLYVDEKYGTINIKNFNVLTQEEYDLLKEVLL